MTLRFVSYNFRKAVKLTENRDYSLQEGIPCYLSKQGELTFVYCETVIHKERLFSLFIQYLLILLVMCHSYIAQYIT